MVVFHDPLCSTYGSSMRPEQPARVTRSVAHLQKAHPDWVWHMPQVGAEDALLLAHTPAHLRRLQHAQDFDADTPFFPGIYDHARRAVGTALAATDQALRSGEHAFSLMRPPGHHATAGQAMGFCYLNSIAVAALHAREHHGTRKIAIWDFDAHHGNGTESILRGREGFLFTSVHQSPCYPGTGTSSFENCLNWPVPPRFPSERHMAALRESLDRIIAFRPDLVLVSAGFDAYANDPITNMTLETNDFSTLGQWLRSTEIPAASMLEGGYSPDLPLLIDAYLSAWEK